MHEVTSAQIAAYEDALAALAKRYEGRNGAEHEDLVQEGRIFVWQSLQRGIQPASAMIENRMKDYVRWLGRQTPIPYEAMLPIDDLTEVAVFDRAPALG